MPAAMGMAQSEPATNHLLGTSSWSCKGVRVWSPPNPVGFEEIKPKVPLRKYSSKKLNFWDHHKLGRYCYGKPNHTNFVWSVCGTYVSRTGRSAGRGSSWDKKRWHFNQIKGYINTLDVAHQRIQHQKIQQLEGNEEDDGEEDMVEEETAMGRTTAKKDKMPATVDNELIDRWRWNNTHC
jgi:hypothetical protein